MNIIINIAERESAINQLTTFRDKEYTPFYVRISNSHIKNLNKVIGRTVFRKDALFINSLSLWEIMQSEGEEGTHHYHGLTPEEVYNALARLKDSNEVYTSYQDRYIVITDVIVRNDLKLVIIISPNEALYKENINNVEVIITIYPSDRKSLMRKNKKWEPSGACPFGAYHKILYH